MNSPPRLWFLVDLDSICRPFGCPPELVRELDDRPTMLRVLSPDTLPQTSEAEPVVFTPYSAIPSADAIPVPLPLRHPSVVISAKPKISWLPSPVETPDAVAPIVDVTEPDPELVRVRLELTTPSYATESSYPPRGSTKLWEPVFWSMAFPTP